MLISYAHFMRVLFILILFIISLPAHAAVYKWLDEKGNVVFGDSPPADHHGEEVEQTPLNTYKDVPPPAAPQARKERNNSARAIRYDKLMILEPKNDAAIRSNGGQLTISLLIEPALNKQANHQIQLKLNGSVIATSSDATITVDNLNRGTHILSADIIDAEGRTLKSSASLTFHLLRHSIL